MVLRAFMRCGAQWLEDLYSPVRGKALTGGDMPVLHTHGRNGQYPPPRHVLATSGGDEAQGACGEPLPDVPSHRLRRTWQWHLLTMLRQTLKTEAINPLVEACVRKSPNGLGSNVHKGTVPAQAQSGARDVATDVVSPPIAVRRIDRDDGQGVTYHDRSPRTDRLEHETVPVDTWSGRLVQHTRPPGCKHMRDDGVQAPKTFAQVKGMSHAALAKGEEVVKGAGKMLARLTSRQRDAQSTGRDPFQCPHCGEERAVWRIWHPSYGVISDEGEGIKRGTYTSSTQRAGP
jgi:hypothetical protein